MLTRLPTASGRTTAWTLIGVLLLAILLPATRIPAHAQERNEDDGVPPLDVRVLEVDAVLADGDPDASVQATLRLDAGDAGREDLRLVTTVHARSEDRAELRSALTGEMPSVYSASSVALDDMAPGTSRVVTIEVTAAELSLVGDGRQGVYPVELQVFQGAEAVGAVRTSVIVLPEELARPMPVTTLVRIGSSDAAPSLRDVVSPTMLDLTAAEGPLQSATRDLVRATADGSASGITLALGGRLLDDLAGMADGFDHIGGTAEPASSMAARRAQAVLRGIAAVARRGDTEVVAFPYGPADLVALVRGGRLDEALDLLGEGPEAVRRTTFATVTEGITVPVDGMDAPTLAALGPSTADALVLDEDYLAFAQDNALEPVRRLLTAGGGEVRLLVPDEDLSVLARDPQGVGTAVVVQQLLAETAVQWLAERPGDRPATDPRAGVLLAIDPLLGGPPDIVEQMTQAIASAPWLRPVDLSRLHETLTPSGRLVRLAYPPRSAAAELPPSYVQRLGAAHDALLPLAAMLPEEDGTASTLADSLTAAASVAYRDPDLQPAGRLRIDTVIEELSSLVDAVQILPSPAVTLTSTTGEVPVTVVNSSDVTLALRARVEAARFSFDSGDTQTFTLPPQSSQRLIFDVESLNPGGFAPISVTVEDASGRLLLDQARISVRSTAFPVVGLIAVVGSLMVLGAWGLKQVRRPPGRHEVERREAA